MHNNNNNNNNKLSPENAWVLVRERKRRVESPASAISVCRGVTLARLPLNECSRNDRRNLARPPTLLTSIRHDATIRFPKIS